MKRLDELGVSPAPWTANEDEVRAADNDLIVCDSPLANARLAAAAPDLYEALREAVFRDCYDCEYWCGGAGCGAYDGFCPTKRWRKALEKAGGAEQ